MTNVWDVSEVWDFLLELPRGVAYALIALGSALENVFPPVPSDTLVILGAVLTEHGTLHPVPILASAWIANVAGARCIYGVARQRGPGFFEEGWGRRLLRPHQFNRISQFYDRYGLWAIFFSRFLPVLRVVIPTFSGFTGLGIVRTMVPVAVASLLWNVTLLVAGIAAARNVARVFDYFRTVNGWLVLVAVVMALAVLYWWILSRRDCDRDRDEGQKKTRSMGSGG